MRICCLFFLLAIMTVVAPSYSQEEVKQNIADKSKPQNFSTKNQLTRNNNIDAKDENGWCALHRAAQAGQFNEVMHLIEQGANPNAIRDIPTTVMEAIGGGILSLSLEETSGWTPLHCAVKEGHLQIVEILIKAGADVSVKDNFGLTPLHKVVNTGHKKIAEILVEHGADVNVKDERGETPLHKAAMLYTDEDELLHAQKKKQIAKILIANGVNLDDRDKDGQTPLHNAAYSKNDELVSLLISSGSKLEIKDNNGKTALDLARSKLVRGDKSEEISKLIKDAIGR